MSPLFPERPHTGSWIPETVRLPDPELERARYVERWQLRAAQWRALDLAERVFGRGVEVSLQGAAGPRPFRGLLRLAVPFRDLEGHREREVVFTSLAGRDPVLGGHPLVYVFDPVTTPDT